MTLALPFVLAAAVVGEGVRYLYFDRTGLPDLEPFLRFQPPAIGEITDARGEVLAQLAREYRRVVRYEELPPVMREAILSAEDKRFFEHSGVDYLALPRVVVKTLLYPGSRLRDSTRKGLVFPQGGSTITQQLVRSYFLRHLTSRENGEKLIGDHLAARLIASLAGPTAANKLIRKAEEIRTALWLEREMRRRFGSRRAAKEQILARYASFMYLGNGRYGFSAASDYYFGRPLSRYTLEDAGEAALLAGIMKSPQRYAPAPGRTAASVRRRNEVLERMVRNRLLPADAARRFRRSRLVLAARDPIKTEAPAVVASVFHELEALGDERVGVELLIEGRIQVRSTVDKRIQRIVNQALERGLSLYEARHPASAGQLQGSVVVLRNRDAALLAEAGGREVYGSRRATYSDYNRATDSARQPGSAMKSILYLAAFHDGSRTLESTVRDEPISVSLGYDKAPKLIANHDRQFKGAIPLRQALAESRNAAATWLAREVGMGRVIRTARELGLTSPLEPYVSTALGASEVRLLELANVYRAMASGIVATPHAIEDVRDAGGSVITPRRPPERTLDAARYGLALIQEGLRGVVRIPGGTAHALDTKGFPIPVMGKTGTTNDYRDALFVGSTYGADGITVAVRLGFDDNRELGEKETGARTALPVFGEVMLEAYGQALVGPVPRFPCEIEEGIDSYLAFRRAMAAQAKLDELYELVQPPAEPLPLLEAASAPDPPRPRPILGRVPPADIAPPSAP